MSLIKRWISLQIDLGSFNSREAVYGFALKMTFRAVLLAFLFNLIALPIFHLLGLLPLSLGEMIQLSVAFSWLVGGAVSGALSLVTGDVIRELSISRAEFERLSRTDMLSGLLNRRAFSEALINTRQHASLAIFDLDRFKSINDCYGHCAGDIVIKAVSDAMIEVFGTAHTTARLGGEEFGAIIRGWTLEHRMEMVERVRALIEARALPFEGLIIHTTISVGVAEFRDDRRRETVYSAADRALYLAKTGGRNRIVHENDIVVGDELRRSAPPADSVLPQAPGVRAIG
ncbi:MAG: GGDEF domain-containing protein [Allorhizobium sp.]